MKANRRIQGVLMFFLMTGLLAMAVAAEEQPVSGNVYAGNITLTLDGGAEPVEPQESTVNTVEYILESGVVTIYVDGVMIGALAAEDGKIETGMSGDGRIWIKTDRGVKKVFPINADKPVDLNVRGKLKGFTTDPSLVGDTTLTGGSEAETMKLTHSGHTNLWGNVGTLSLYNSASLTANTETVIEKAYLYSRACRLTMQTRSRANAVYTDHRNENLRGKDCADAIHPLS